jgi:hypothetical protein
MQECVETVWDEGFGGEDGDGFGDGDDDAGAGMMKDSGTDSPGLEDAVDETYYASPAMETVSANSLLDQRAREGP